MSPVLQQRPMLPVSDPMATRGGANLRDKLLPAK